MKRITITADESIFEQLEAASKESMRPIATEALYRIKLGLGSAIQPQTKLSEVGGTKEVGEIEWEEIPATIEEVGEKGFKTYFKNEQKKKRRPVHIA